MKNIFINDLGKVFTIHGLSFRLVNQSEIVERDIQDGNATVCCCDLDKIVRLPMPGVRKRYLIGVRESVEFFLDRGENVLDFMYPLDRSGKGK